MLTPETTALELVRPVDDRALARADRLERIRDTARRSRADRTLQEYARAWRTFVTWCAGDGSAALPASADTVAAYLRDRADAGRKLSTLTQDLAAISLAHRDGGYPSPTEDYVLRTFVKGLRRELGVAAHGQRDAATADKLRAMLATIPEGLLGLRDRAVLVVGFVGAFRRSELVGLAVEDLRDERDGIVATVRRSKTDQEGAGFRKALPYSASADHCPVRSLRAWLEAARIVSGPVFRAVDRHGRVGAGPLSGRTVALVVKRRAQAAGLDPAQLSGHSLRIGFVSTAAQQGRSERAIANQTGHRSMPVLRGYIRRATVFTDNAAVAIF